MPDKPTLTGAEREALIDRITADGCYCEEDSTERHTCLQGLAEYALNTIDALRAENERLREYADHKRDCRHVSGWGCTCGWDALRRSAVSERPTTNAQTCPRRMQDIGPWERKEGIDTWRTDRWNADTEAQRAKNAAEIAAGEGRVHLSETHGMWLWPWGPARTCSFCGGIHPEDAIRLAREGWEGQPTTKGYKWYLNPPGTEQKREAFLRSLTAPEIVAPSVWSPVPPVKLYVMHFDAAQAEAFNAELKRRNEGE